MKWPASALFSEKQTHIRALFLIEDFSGYAVRLLLLLLRVQSQGQNGVRLRNSPQGLYRWWKGSSDVHVVSRGPLKDQKALVLPVCVEGLSRPVGHRGLLGNFAGGKNASTHVSRAPCQPESVHRGRAGQERQQQLCGKACVGNLTLLSC